MKPTPALWIYHAAWEPTLLFARVLAALKFFPRWRLAERLGKGWNPPPDQPALWMHAASLGECKGLWALAQSLTDMPISFLLTANTTAGLDFLSEQVRRISDPSRWRCSLAPFDHPRIVRRFLRHFHVQALILFEVELWPHFILMSQEKGRPVFWISARLTPKARRSYSMFPGVLRTLFSAFTWVQAQKGEDVETFHSWGCKSVEAGADLRGLHYLTAEKSGKGFRIWKDRMGVAFLSLHAAELPSLLSVIKSQRNDTPLFVFPRKMEELPLFRKVLEPLGFALHSQHPESRLLIMDSFGKVSEFLESCHTAVVGGSFAPLGGHNLWEPLAAGISMVIGPHHGNQEYLVRKLEASRLLRISKSPLKGESLRKPDVDPGLACRDFIETEKSLLLASANRIRAGLLLYCP